jgi:hypothetical protein
MLMLDERVQRAHLLNFVSSANKEYCKSNAKRWSELNLDAGIEFPESGYHQSHFLMPKMRM